MGLFGGSNDQTETVSAPWKPARQPLRDVISDYGDLRNNPFEFFPGQTYADFDPRQIEAMEGIYDYSGSDVMDPAMAAYNSALNAPDVANNPYVNAMIDDQRMRMNQQLTEDILPGVRMNAVGAGGYGGSGGTKAQVRMAQNAQDAFNTGMVNTQMDAYGKGLSAQQGALGQASNLFNMGLQPWQNKLAVGGMYRGQDELGIGEDMARHQFEQDEPWKRLGMYSDAIRGIGSMGGTTRSEQPGQSIADQMLGAGLTLGSAYLTGGGSLGAGMFGGGSQPAMNYGMSSAPATRFNMGMNAYPGY